MPSIFSPRLPLVSGKQPILFIGEKQSYNVTAGNAAVEVATGTEVGDYHLMLYKVGGSNNGAPVFPAGWTTILPAPTGTNRFQAAYRMHAAGDPTLVQPMSGGNVRRIVLMTFRNAAPYISSDLVLNGTSGGGTQFIDGVAKTILPQDEGSALLFIGFSASTTSSTPSHIGPEGWETLVNQYSAALKVAAYMKNELPAGVVPAPQMSLYGSESPTTLNKNKLMIQLRPKAV